MSRRVQEVRHHRRGIEHVLEVVEQQQRRRRDRPGDVLAKRVRRRSSASLAESQHLPQRGHDARRIDQRRQRKHEHAASEFVHQRPRGLECQTCLAAAARAAEGQQANVRVLHQSRDVFDLARAPDEWRPRRRQAATPWIAADHRVATRFQGLQSGSRITGRSVVASVPPEDRGVAAGRHFDLDGVRLSLRGVVVLQSCA
jgi:hypothetical protein